LSIAPHGQARRTTPEHRRRSGVPRAVAMKLTGHETDAVYSRYHIAPGEGPTRRRCACRRLHRGPKRLSTRVRQRDRDGDQGSESEFAQVIEKWRRAGDSNPDTGYPVVDFKSKPFCTANIWPSVFCRELAATVHRLLLDPVGCSGMLTGTMTGTRRPGGGDRLRIEACSVSL
jgi:hypothetical protein